ncbi:type II toxin-antitoxin system RelE/ParE family toxin [Breznakiellaceae bacterium SP9]
MRAFKNKVFSRFAQKGGIADDELKLAVAQLNAGQVDAVLGGDVYKMRIPRTGEGKSGGYRVIVLCKRGDKAFFVHGFAKKDAANITDKELKRFKENAKDMLALNEKVIKTMLENKDLQEVKL